MWLVCQSWLYVMLSLPFSHPLAGSPTFPFLSSLCHPPFFFHAPLLPTFFLVHWLSQPHPFWPSLLHATSANCLPLSLSPPLPLPSFFPVWLSKREAGRACWWPAVDFTGCLWMSSCRALWQGLLKPSGCFRYMHTLNWIHAHPALYGHELFTLFSLGWSTRDGVRGGGVKEIWAEERRGSGC